jgi:uncharacterized membrane protein YcfT
MASHLDDLQSLPVEQERVAWVDAAKGICIILVVMMHTTLGLSEQIGREGWLNDVVAFAKPFRMPDFFLLSGLFLAKVIDRDWRKYADRRIIHFVYFYILWLLIQSVFKITVVSGGSVGGFVAHLLLALVEPFGTLWFLYLLAAFGAATKLLRRVSPSVLLAGAAILEFLPVNTGWILIDEFADRYVYFLGGYLLAPFIFTIAQEAARRPIITVAGLGLWAAVNGVFAFAPTGHPLFPTWASLPFISLGLGAIGAMAVVSLASLLTKVRLAGLLAYCGQHSMAIYLSFFLPMAITRILFIKFDLVADVGTTAAVMTAVAIISPLVIEKLVRNTRLGFLFVRPALFGLPGKSKLADKPVMA